MQTKSLVAWAALAAWSGATVAVAADGKPAVANLVKNPGFELDADANGSPDHWRSQRKGVLRRIERPDRKGDWCVEISGAEGKAMPLWSQTNLALTGGRRYVVAYDAWAPVGARYRCYLEWWKKDGKYGSSSLRHAGWRKGAGAWERNVFVFPYPADAKPPYIVLQLEGAGSVRFDNVLVTEPIVEPTRPGNVFNSSFEASGGAWALTRGAAVCDQEARHGKLCLRLTGEKKGHDASAVYRGVPTQVGRRYRLTFYAKAGGGSKETTGFQYFRVVTSWDRLVKDGRDYGAVSQRDGQRWQDCFASWQRRTLEFTAPAKPTAGMNLTCQVRGPGTVFIDDIELKEIAAPPVAPPGVRVTLDRPYYRDAVFATAPIDSVAGRVRVEAPGAARVSVTLLDARSKPLHNRKLDVAKVPSDVAFEVPLAKAADGDRTLVVTAENKDGRKLADQRRTIRRLAPAPIEVRVRDDNMLIVNGEPFFAIGFWRAPSSERALRELAEAGVNVVRMMPTPEALDMAARAGVRVMGNIPNNPPAEAAKRREWEAKARGKLEPVLGHAALLGYYIVDEPLWCGRPLQPLVEAYAFCRRLDPYRPIWLNAAPRGAIRDLAKYNQACDITGVDIYPVPEGGGHSELEDKSVSSVGEYTDRMRASVEGRKPVWMTLQAFAWKHLRDRHSPEGLYPTFEQSRFMAYNAVIHGATGIMYWGSHYIADPAFWEVLKRTTSELRDVSGLLASRTVAPTSVKASHAPVRFLHKRAGAVEAVVAANEGKDSLAVTFNTPWPDGPCHVLFEDRTVAVEAGRFTDTFGPNAVHVYCTSAKPPAPAGRVRASGGEPEGLSLAELTAAYLNRRDYRGKANWVWVAGRSNAPDMTCCVRRVVELGAAPAKAILTVTADDEYECMVNGRPIMADDAWSFAHPVDVTSLLKPGPNVIAVSARDAGTPPCAVLAELTVTQADGRKTVVVTDADWKASPKPAKGWLAPDFDAKGWTAAEVVAPYGRGAWRNRLLVGPVLSLEQAVAHWKEKTRKPAK